MSESLEETLERARRAREAAQESLAIIDEMFPEDDRKVESDEPRRQYGKERP